MPHITPLVINSLEDIHTHTLIHAHTHAHTHASKHTYTHTHTDVHTETIIRNHGQVHARAWFKKEIEFNVPMANWQSHYPILIMNLICQWDTFGTKLVIRDQPIMLLFYPLCYVAVLLKFTYYAQYYAQEHELLSDHYAFYMQFCMSSSLHIADILYRLFY